MRIKKLKDNAVMPIRGSEDAAGWDLYAALDEPVTILPGTCKKISTGIAIEIPTGYFGAIYPRSGLATKRGLRMSNGVGVVDSDYRGPVICALYNDSDESQIINNGDRIAQLIIQPFFTVDLEWSDNLDDTERGDGGFGSTGK